MKEKERNGFIDQTAKDYDMEYEEVEKVYKMCRPADFFEVLETIIKNRANKP